MEIEIGRGKKARRAYGFDDIAIVPSRRTRDAEDVDIAWRLGPHLLELPLLAAAMDGVVSPATAIALGSQQRGGGIGPLGQQRRRPADGAVAPVTAPVRGVVGAALAAVDLHHAVVRTCAGTRPGGRRGEQDEGGGEECDRQQAAHAPEPTTRARSR